MDVSTSMAPNICPRLIFAPSIMKAINVAESGSKVPIIEAVVGDMREPVKIQNKWYNCRKNCYIQEK